MPFRYDPRAAALLSEAHRRPASWVDAPALTRHLAFWPMAEADAQLKRDEPSYRRARNRWLRAINRVLRALQSPTFGGPQRGEILELALAAIDGPPPATRLSDTTDGPRTLPIRRASETVVLPIHWRGLAGSAHLERHTEYVTLSIALTVADGACGEAEAAARAAPTVAGQAYRLIARLRAEAAGGGEVLAEAADAEALRTAAEAGFDALWRAFDEDLEATLQAQTLDAAEREDGPEDAADVAFEEALEDGVEDGVEDDGDRDVRRGDRDVRRGDATEATAPCLFLIGRAFADFRGLLAALDEPIGAGYDRDAVPQPFDAEEARRTLNRLRRFSAIALAGGSEQKREFTANRFLGGHALFVSTLSAPAPAPAPAPASAATPAPHARYLLAFRKPPARMQCGRLVERLHAVETLRLAALRDIDVVRTAGRRIRFLARRLDDIEEEHVTQLDAAGVSRITREVETIADQLSHLGAEAVGGLSYRITRSSFYTDAFFARMKEFRIEPIETWQPYDAFMRRRIFQTFDYITRVGRRREALLGRINMQISLIQAANMSRGSTELVALHGAAMEAQQSTDMLSYAVWVVGMMALTVSAADGLPYAALGLGVDGPQSWASKEMWALAIGLVLGLISVGLHQAVAAFGRWRRRTDK